MKEKKLDDNMSINWTSMIKPAGYKMKVSNNPSVATFEIEPLERGYSTTLGNCLRRVLMSSLSGTAICALKIEGIEHEYSTVEFIREDLVEIILNLKAVSLKGNLGYETKKAILHISKEGSITASEIQLPNGITVTNPNQIICSSTSSKANIKIELIICSGKGYLSSNEQKNLGQDFIAIDSLFSPIKNCFFQAETSRIGSKTEFDKLVLTIETNNSISPEIALGLASKILQDQLQCFISFKDVKEVSKPVKEELPFNKNLLRKVADQELSVRSQNCLKVDKIIYLGDLVTKSEAQMLKTPNFGRKSLNEIKHILDMYKLSFGMSVSNWPPKNIEELVKKYLESDH